MVQMAAYDCGRASLPRDLPLFIAELFVSVMMAKADRANESRRSCTRRASFLLRNCQQDCRTDCCLSDDER